MVLELYGVWWAGEHEISRNATTSWTNCTGSDIKCFCCPRIERARHDITASRSFRKFCSIENILEREHNGNRRGACGLFPVCSLRLTSYHKKSKQAQKTKRNNKQTRQIQSTRQEKKRIEQKEIHNTYITRHSIKKKKRKMYSSLTNLNYFMKPSGASSASSSRQSRRRSSASSMVGTTFSMYKSLECPIFLKKLLRRFIVYVTFNGFIVSLAYLSHAVLSSSPTSMEAEVVTTYAMALVRMISCVSFFELLRYGMNLRRIHPTKDSSHDDNGMWDGIYGIFFVAGVMEVVWIILITHSTYFNIEFLPNTGNYVREYLLFIPKSLVIELMFDFGHYWTHRYCHRNKILFKYVHHDHHTHSHPGPLSTYCQSHFDVLFTNILPWYVAMAFGPSLTMWQYHLFVCYKTFIEVAGHSGFDTNAPSFPQLPLLPWICKKMNANTTIVLYNKEHDWHHYKPTANFSKRFSIWDRIFGTYEQPKFHLRLQTRNNNKENKNKK